MPPDVKIGPVVRSTKGRDAGRLFLVVGFADEEHALLCDGDLRRIDSPKKKKRKHFLPTQELISSLGERLTRGEAVCDAHIRKALAALRDQGLDAPCKEVKECRSRM